MLHCAFLWLLLATLVGCRAAPPPAPALGRCIWVDRWDYRTAADIERVLDDCRQAGFTAVMFQVRGNGTVCFASALEPWSEQFGFRDPGFDPLAVAVRQAHARGLELHAWLNVMPGWIGIDEPASARQLWRSHRDWFLQDRDNGWQQRAAGKYLTLNPCRPEVRTHLTALCREVAAKYEVDGIHLDYIRFPDPEGDDVDALGRDVETMSLFTSATGRTRDDLAALHRWQADCVTTLVTDIAAAVRATRRPARLSAAVSASPQQALAALRQDWGRWCRLGLVDALMPMNYSDRDDDFAARARACVRQAAGVPVVVGVGVYKHRDGAQSRRQLDAALAAGAAGIGVFGYRALFGPSNEVPVARQRELQQGVVGWIEASMPRPRR